LKERNNLEHLGINGRLIFETDLKTQCVTYIGNFILGKPCIFTNRFHTIIIDVNDFKETLYWFCFFK
jgi:hypothetical protein